MSLPPDIFHWNTCPKKYSNSYFCDRKLAVNHFAHSGLLIWDLLSCLCRGFWRENMWLKRLFSKVDKHHLQYMNFKKLNPLRLAVVWKKACGVGTTWEWINILVWTIQMFFRGVCVVSGPLNRFFHVCLRDVQRAQLLWHISKPEHLHTHTHTHTHTFISTAITLSHLTHTKQPRAGQQHTLTHSFITHFNREMLYELEVVLTTQWEKTKRLEKNTETWENHLTEMRLWWRPHREKSQMRSIWYRIYLSDESLLLLKGFSWERLQ